MDRHGLTDRGTALMYAGPVILWPLVLLFVAGLLVSVAWRLLARQRRK
ncbi:hypothetical protein [Haladaptatus sp. W1]|nr:hypothetical protein [Haladaptatus sp. W1]